MKAILMLATVALCTGAAVARQHPDPRGAIFVKRGCTDCHAISGLGRQATRDVAPDLTFAYGEVVARYGVTLESFLADPPGTMELVLASRHRLNPVDRDSMVAILKRLYEQRRAGL